MLYRVVGTSMEPAYSDGQLLLVSKWARTLIREGDTVVALDPRDHRLILKRVKEMGVDSYFLMGDNPISSTDSRAFGYITKENIIGRVIMKFPQSKQDKMITAVGILAFLGLVDATYLTVKHFTGGKVVCGAIPGLDCDVVLGSIYSEFFGIPLALLGALYYAGVLTVIVGFWKLKQHALLQLLFGLTSIGVITSLYLVYIQAFVLYAYCLYCMTSAFISFTLFGLSSFLLFGKRN